MIDQSVIPILFFKTLDDFLSDMQSEGMYLKDEI